MAQGIQKLQQRLPFPQQGLSQHFQANELHCIFSQGQKPLQRAFCSFGTSRLGQNSKRNLGHNVSNLDDKGNRIPLLQRKEIVKWLQLLPVIKGDSFVTSGWLRWSSSTGSAPQENRIQVHAAQFKHTIPRFWNAGLSWALAQSHFQLHQDIWAGLLTTYQCLIEHLLWNGGSQHQPQPVYVGTTCPKKSSSQLEARVTLERLEQRLVYSRIHSLHQLCWEYKSQKYLLCTESKRRYLQNASAISTRH